MYSIHTNVKLRQGGRTIVPLTRDEFINEMDKFINNTIKKGNENSWDFANYQSLGNYSKVSSYDFLKFFNRAMLYAICDKSSIQYKDMKGIEADYENFDYYIGEIERYSFKNVFAYTKKDHIPYLRFEVSGDWELPMIIMCYFDGKQFRIYVPEKGNTWRKDIKQLFGNNTEEEDYDEDSEFPSDNEYVRRQLLKQGDISKDTVITEEDILENLEANIEMCTEDFESRVNQ